MKLSEKIYTCRKKAGLSQEALAEKLGVSRQAVSKWETEEAVPELMKIPAMAKLFGVTTDWLLSEDENEENFENPPIPEAPPAPTAARQRQNPARHTWIVGVVIACIGAPFVLVGAVALIFISILTMRTVKTDELNTNVFEQEFVFPDGSMPAQWNEDMEKFFFQNGTLFEEFLEQTETTASTFETRKEE